MSKSILIKDEKWYVEFMFASADAISDHYYHSCKHILKQLDTGTARGVPIRRLKLKWRKAVNRYNRMLINDNVLAHNLHGLIQQRHKVMGVVDALRRLGEWDDIAGRPLKKVNPTNLMA